MEWAYNYSSSPLPTKAIADTTEERTDMITANNIINKPPPNNKIISGIKKTFFPDNLVILV